MILLFKNDEYDEKPPEFVAGYDKLTQACFDQWSDVGCTFLVCGQDEDGYFAQFLNVGQVIGVAMEMGLKVGDERENEVNDE